MVIRRISRSTFTTLATAIGAIFLTPLASFPVEAAAPDALSVPFAKAPIAPVKIDTSRGVDFAQNHSDLLPDPALRFGKLANGMTYVIARNKTPPGKATVRLRIAAGSMMESENQRGLAHFLEHMAFKGSKHVPEDEMIRILERHGLSFGADTNAYTTFGETGYVLEIPKVSDETVDTVMFLLREVAGNLNITQEAIERERGVILGEERVRNTPQTAMTEYIAHKMFDGQKLPDRIPIGLIPVLKGAQRADFVDFYQAFYRPELATLVVAGDIDPDAMEARIKAKFGDWKPAVPGAIRQIDFGTYRNKGLQADSYVSPGLGNSISMTWTRPVDEHYQTVAKGLQELLSSVAINIVNERFSRLAARGEASFISASVGRGAFGNAGESVALSIGPKAGQDKAAYQQAYTMLRQFVLYGPDKAELDRALNNLEVRNKAAVESAATRGTDGLAQALLGSLGAGVVVSSAAQDYALYRSLLPQLTLANVGKAAKELVAWDGPFLWHSAEDLKGLGKEELLAGFRAVQAAKIEAPASLAAKAWPYTEFPGAAAAVVSRRQIERTGATELTYANGVKVIVKPTTYAKSAISVTVRFAGGLKSISPAEDAALFEARNLGLIQGGLGKIDAIDAGDSLTGKILGVSFGIGDDSSVMAGNTVPSDLSTLMQVLMAYTTDAAYRPQPFSQFKQIYRENYPLAVTSPDGVLGRYLAAIQRSEDPRFVTHTPDEVDKVNLEKAQVLVERQLKTAPIEITVVGDTSEAMIEAEVAKTFAKLSPRATVPFEPAGADVVKFPSTNLQHTLTHEGRADQAIGYIAWPTTDLFANIQDTAALRMLTDVIGLRLIAQVRQEKALTYSPKAGADMSDTFKGFGYISARVEVRPEKLPEFYSIVNAIVEDLKAKPVSADELLRARQPALDRLVNADKNNGYWVGALSGYTSDPRRLEFVEGRRDRYAAVTPSDLQRLAQQYLVDAKALKIEVKPATDKAVRAAPQ
ncbi:M16 family metallopeptidase [Burkholderiaceae bacterium UC74_6]